MIEVALQILLILAYLAIGLIAVTFPIYALCVTYLKEEKREAEHQRSERLKTVKEKIASLVAKKEERDSENLGKINAEIEGYETEKKELENRLKPLTAKGAVGTPVIVFGVALLLAVIGIVYADIEIMQGVHLFGILSVLTTVYGLFSLFDTITRIESAALRSERTINFRVQFKSTEKTQAIKIGKEERIDIGIYPEEDVNKFEARMYFPPQVEIRKAISGIITIQPEGYDFAGYSMVFFEKDFMSKSGFWGYGLTIFSDQIGDYPIVVRISGMGLRHRDYILTLKVRK